jgi:Lectin C-type domain
VKHADAARILDLADPPPRRSTPAVALGLAILTIAGIFCFAAHEVSARGSLHSAHQAGSLSRSTEFERKTTAMESDKMKKLIAIGVVSTAISASAMAQNAVQWRVEDGGNGHWYRFESSPAGWATARAESAALGGYLVTVNSAPEGDFLRTLGVGTAWIGLLQNPASPGFSEPASGWEWISGEPLNYTNWRVNTNGQPNEPNNIDSTSTDVAVMDAPERTTWNDVPQVGAYSYWVEWSADCNNDSIVDYGQIRAGEYADVNANNIPDCCEYSTPCDCAADIIEDNAINGVDLAAIMNAWGTDGGKIPRCDVDGSGIVDGSDLTIVLDAWGPCP